MAQLKGGLCFFKYFQAIGQEFWNDKDFLKKYTHYFVCIKKLRSPRKEMVNIKKDSNITPENKLDITISNQPIFFKKMIV